MLRTVRRGPFRVRLTPCVKKKEERGGGVGGGGALRQMEALETAPIHFQNALYSFPLLSRDHDAGKATRAIECQTVTTRHVFAYADLDGETLPL